jgi:hypothetical protein
MISGLRRSITSALRARLRFAATRAFALSRESLSLPNGGRESNQREGHPGSSPSGPSALQVRARWPLVGDRTSMCVRRQAASMRPPCGLSATTDHRRSGAPKSEEARSSAQKQDHEHCTFESSVVDRVFGRPPPSHYVRALRVRRSPPLRDPVEQRSARRRAEAGSSAARTTQSPRYSPNTCNGATRSQVVFNTIRIGTASRAPGMPHIQPQKRTDNTITTGLRLRRRPTISGVTR